MKYFVFLLLLSTFLSACSSSQFPQAGVKIKVLNHSDVDFDTLKMFISLDSESLTELVFTDLDDGDKKTHYVDQLEYMFYDENSDFIFFSNIFNGISEDQTHYGTGYGFCGTGLKFKIVEEGTFKAIITGVDKEQKRMFITQEKE